MYTSPDFWAPAPELQRSELNLSYRGNKYVSHLVAPDINTGPRPLVLVIHNYQGLKRFDVNVAEYMARLGYVGLALDLYGETVPAAEREFPTDPEKVPDFQKKCFEGMVSVDHDHEFFRSLLKAWLDEGYAQPQVDATFPAAAIGYCFGGMAVIECVRGGLNVGGVVSFHGLLQTGEDPNPPIFGATRPPLKTCANHYNTRAVIQIENGADDPLVPDDSKQRFFTEMNEAGVDWVFNHYSGTPHGFALPKTIGPPGHLHEASDRRSTMNMLNLFREIFPGVPQKPVPCNAAGTPIPA